MKKILFCLVVFVSFVFSGNISAQYGMLSSQNDIIGETSEFFIGLHSGLFDANQTVTYPYNIGLVAQYNYIPNVVKSDFNGLKYPSSGPTIKRQASLTSFNTSWKACAKISSPLIFWSLPMKIMIFLSSS